MPVQPSLALAMLPFPLSLTLDEKPYQITAPLYGVPERGLFWGQQQKSEDRPVLITVGFRQTRSYDELTQDLALAIPSIAPLRFIGELPQVMIDAPMDVMIEGLPWGAPSCQVLSLPLPPDHVIALGSAISSILHAAHNHGKVVQGLRPEMIYLHPMATGYVLTGLVPRCELFWSTAQRACVGIPPCFTHSYRAPEVLRGYPATPAADVFSLCAVLMHWLIGKHPFARQDYQREILAMIAGERPTRPHADPLYRLLDRGLTQDADTRLTLGELMTGLANA